MEVALAPILKLVLAVLIGGAIGLERQKHHMAAGLRTHILVCLTSTALMSSTVFQYGQQADPASRIAQGIIMGIGFLGAGTILSKHGHVLGLTTAASVWCVAALGIIIGMGEYFTAMLVTLLVVLLLKNKQLDRILAKSL